MEPSFQKTLRTSQRRARTPVPILVVVLSGLWASCGAHAWARADDDSPLVINEVLITPPLGEKQFIEYFNRGESDLDLFRWWICHQPSSRYYRLLQVPQGTGAPMTASIVLGPGDFLVTTWGLEAAGGYTTRPNSAGTTTHEVSINAFIPLFLFDPQSGNLSVWDQIPPDFPCFGEPNLIRDFVAWGAGGTYVGAKRGCTAFAAGLWSAPIESDCTDINNVVLLAVDSSSLVAEDNLSIQYNNGSDNDPNDYIIATATPGEPNEPAPSCMPGDVNGDGSVNGLDIQGYAAVSLGFDTEPAHICAADTLADGTIDCHDTPVLVIGMGAAGCIPGDGNGDGAVDGRDIPRMLEILLAQPCPSANELCALDVTVDQRVDESDVPGFVSLLLTATLRH